MEAIHACQGEKTLHNSWWVSFQFQHHETGTKQKEGGWSLVAIKTTIQDEAGKIQKYSKNMALNNEQLSECLRQKEEEMDRDR